MSQPRIGKPVEMWLLVPAHPLQAGGEASIKCSAQTMIHEHILSQRKEMGDKCVDDST
jgi:hypothetical protein